MKTSSRYLFLGATVAFFLALTLAVLAQDTKQPDAPPPPADQAAVTAPSVQPATPVATPADGTTVATTPEPAPAPAPKEETPARPKMRRLDEPSQPVGSKSWRRIFRDEMRHHRSGNGSEIVNIGHDAFLAKGGQADMVVSVFGSATSEGEVAGSVVSVFGNTRVTGPVSDGAVAVFGNTYVNSKVGDGVVAVFGNVELGPDAEVTDVVAVGGTIIRDPKAIVHGEVHNVSFGGHFSNFDWLQSWITNCALSFRLLAFAPNLMWAWWIALGFLALYVVLALLFRSGVERCVTNLETRPGASILAALLTVFLAPIAMLVLSITGIGLAVVPFLAAAIFFATIFGKVAMLAWLGRRLGRMLGTDHPAMAVLIGGVILLFLYTIPVAGLIVYKLLGWVGLGVVVFTLASSMKRQKPIMPPVIPPTPGAMPGNPGDPAALPALISPPVAAVTLPRAGFWIRLAALLLDVILVAMICTVLSNMLRDTSHVRIRADLLPALAIYGAVMWKLRGSTVGGIVCGLKVVRLDDRPLDWGTTIVRALACFLSLIVCGLGFLWVVFDDQRQSWHDKIAGTTVVRVPRGVSLV